MAGAHVESTRTEAGWTVTARWSVEAGDTAMSTGPTEAVIRLAEDASPVVRQRGVTSGVMRRMERLIAEMTAELHAKPTLTRPSEIARAHAKELVAGMPDNPRKDAASYYSGLLAALAGLEQQGAPDPLNVLADVLDIPKNTLRTQLQAARRRLRG